MVQNRFKVNVTTSKFLKFICASLVIALQFYFSGCATPIAWKLAKKKASPANCSYLNITSVQSAVEQENGDISIYVDLEGSNGTESSSYTFTLPISSLAGYPTDLERHGFRPCESSPIDTYWYPIEKATRGYGAGIPADGSAGALLPIEKLSVPVKDKPQLYNIMSNLNREPEGKKRLYEVNFGEEPMEVGVYSYDQAADKMVFEQSKESREVILVYYPTEATRKVIKPLIIAGGYEDTSTNLYYYLAVPPAVAFDAALIAAAVGAVGLASYGPVPPFSLSSSGF
jgi:hypothetical protein